MQYCPCLTKLKPLAALRDLKEEIQEFFHEPSMDEFSDCSFALGRLVAGLFGKVYIPLPFDGLHREKINKRMKEYGCVRSARHLVNNRCPSI